MIINLKDAKSYMHVDHDDDDELIRWCIYAAHEYISDAIGDDYYIAPARAYMITNMVVSELYDNRGITERASAKIRTIIDNFSQQIRLELSKRRRDNIAST